MKRSIVRKLGSCMLAAAVVLGSIAQPLQPVERAHAATTGVLQNAGFETYTGTNGVADGWASGAPEGATGSFEIVNQPAMEGTQAQKVSVSGMADGQKAFVDQTIPIDPNTGYELSAYFKVESLQNAVVQLYLDYTDANGVALGGGPAGLANVTDGYVRLDFSKIAPAGATHLHAMAIVRATGADAAGTFYVDRFEVRKSSGQLVNAGFEQYSNTTGVADFWLSGKAATAVANMAVVDVPVASGYKAQKVSGSNIPYGRNVYIGQVINAEPNASYTVTGKFNVEHLDRAKVQLFIDYFDANDTWLKNSVTEQTQTTGGSYVELKNETVTPAGTAYFKVYALLRAMAEGASGTFYADQMKVQQTEVIPPELPIIDLNTFPYGSGIVEASVGYNTRLRAFDRDSSTYWYIQNQRSGSIEYDFQAPAVVREYGIYPPSISSAPSSWSFSGWDGKYWLVLDEKIRVSAEEWKQASFVKIPISNKKAYSKYRLSIHMNVSSPDTNVSEIYMRGYFAKPEQMAKPTVSAVGNGTATLNWTVKKGTEKVNIYQDGVKINTLTGANRSVTMNRLTNLRQYKFAISAENGAGESPLSNEVTVMPYSLSDSLVPQMTSDTTPVGTVLGSGHSGTSGKYQVFDRSYFSYHWSTLNGFYIGYDFENPTVVRGYSYKNPSGPTGAYPLKNFTFEGWDGANWVQLDKQENAVGSYWFPISNQKAYTKYRLNVTAVSNPDAQYVYLAELEFIGYQ